MHNRSGDQKALHFNKRNASSVFDSSNNRNKSVPEKPFHVDGKEVYVIDPPPDTEQADIQIIEKRQEYEDLSTKLSKTGKWPEQAGHQYDMLNSRCDDTSNISGSSIGRRSSPRSKSSNLLDHINQDSRNANRDIPVTRKLRSSKYFLTEMF